MFKIIAPPSHEVYQSEIDTLLYYFQVYRGIEIPLEEQAKSTFIIAKDPKCGVYGGAILRKRSFKDPSFKNMSFKSASSYALDETIETTLSTLYSKTRKVWLVELCTALGECETLSKEAKVLLLRDFHSQLLKKLMVFGKQQKINFLIPYLCPSDYVITSTYHDWPYILEVPPQDTLDNHFQGILSLNLKKREHRIKPPLKQPSSVEEERP